MNDGIISTTLPKALPKALHSRQRLEIVAAALFVIGGAAGAATIAATRPTVTMAPATPVAIRSLSDEGIVTIRARVAETYGNKFVMQDQTGRALVDTGRVGENDSLVAGGQTVTVQGRFEHGFVHAAFLVGTDGKVTALGPIGGPPRHGPGERHGPDREAPDRDTPPPAVQAVPAVAPAK